MREAIIDVPTDAEMTVAKLFDAAFRILKHKAHRHEYVYKAALAQRILLGRHNLRTATMLTEFRVGPCKLDAAIINGTSTAYEIKSERDHLGRLPTQLEAYLRVFAQVYVVTGQSHLDSVCQLAPADVGILLLTERFQLHEVRAALDDPERLEAAILFESLRVGELRRILLFNGIEPPVVPNTQERQALREVFVQLAPGQIHAAMIDVLRRSRGQSALDSLIDAAPPSLWAAIIATPIRKQDEEHFLNALTTPALTAYTWA